MAFPRTWPISITCCMWLAGCAGLDGGGDEPSSGASANDQGSEATVGGGGSMGSKSSDKGSDSTENSAEEESLDPSIETGTGADDHGDSTTEEGNSDLETADGETGSVCPMELLHSEFSGAYVLLTVDRSGSMSDSWTPASDDGRSRWRVVREAIESLLESRADRVGFGAKLFPTEDAEAVGELACLVDEGVEVPFGLSAGALLKKLPGKDVFLEGGTPILTAGEMAYEYLDYAAEIGGEERRIVHVLVMHAGLTCDEDIGDLVPLAEKAWRKDMPTAVLSVDEVDMEFVEGLDALALAGGTDSRIVCNEAEELNETLISVVDQLVPCTAELAVVPGPGEVSELRIAGELLPSVHNFGSCEEARLAGYLRGWRFFDKTRRNIEFCGDACSDFGAGQEVVFLPNINAAGCDRNVD